MNRQEKEIVIRELHEKCLEAKTAIITEYRGLNVAAMNELRGQLRAASVEYRIVKNTLLKRSAENTSLAPLASCLEGPCGVAISKSDPVAPAKVLLRFAKENALLKVKIGVLDGVLLDVKDIQALADLPSRDVLLSQLLSAMNAVPTGFVNVLAGVLRNLLGVLTAVKDQKEKPIVSELKS
ncbi:MAG: 50S ribosomal protein L10 [Pseudomonadota bacterium]